MENHTYEGPRARRRAARGGPCVPLSSGGPRRRAMAGSEPKRALRGHPAPSAKRVLWASQFSLPWAIRKEANGTCAQGPRGGGARRRDTQAEDGDRSATSRGDRAILAGGGGWSSPAVAVAVSPGRDADGRRSRVTGMSDGGPNAPHFGVLFPKTRALSFPRRAETLSAVRRGNTAQKRSRERYHGR